MTEEKTDTENSDSLDEKISGRVVEIKDDDQPEINAENLNVIENSSAENPLTETGESAIQDTPEDEDPVNKFQEYFSVKEETEIPKITETILTFLKLKNVDEELADIEDAKGDLPESIQSLEQKLALYNREFEILTESLNTHGNEMELLKKENDVFEEKINKYDEQKYNVKSNKEYDEIVKAIESMFDEVSKNEAAIKDRKIKSEELQTKVTDLESKIGELKSELDEKISQLKELDEEFKQEESALNEKRTELSKGLDENDLDLYNRVNSKHKGEATAIVRRGNCSGCFNSIPPQRVIEIKAAEKIFTCQSCGRILISEELINN